MSISIINLLAMVSLSRKTRQKTIIVQEIAKIGQFFNAEELYKRARKKEAHIGIATVYRVLKDLKNTHKLHAYWCDKRIIYSQEDKSHCHFICEKCNKVSHLPLEKLDFLKKNVQGSICHVQIDVTGICEGCL